MEKFPLVLVVANNQYAYSTPTSRQFACRPCGQSRRVMGSKGIDLDGTDLGSVSRCMGEAVAAARVAARARNWSSRGLLRLCGHGEHDDASYVERETEELPARS